MATSNIKIDTGSTLALAAHTISEDAITKYVGRSVLANSAGTELSTDENPLKVNLAVIGTGTLARINSVNTVAVVSSMFSLANVASVMSVNTIGVVSNISSIGALVSVSGTINSVSTVNLVATINTLNTLLTVATINSLNAVGIVSSVANLGTLATLTTVGSVGVVATVNTVGTVSFLASANIGSVGTLTTVTNLANANITSIGTVNTVATINTLNTLAQFAHSIKNKVIVYSAASETTLVPATTNKLIKVTAFSVISGSTAANNISFKSSASGAIVWTVPIGTVYGANLAVPPPAYIFVSSDTSTPIAISFSTANTATVCVGYFDDDSV